MYVNYSFYLKGLNECSNTYCKEYAVDAVWRYATSGREGDPQFHFTAYPSTGISLNSEWTEEEIRNMKEIYAIFNTAFGVSEEEFQAEYDVKQIKVKPGPKWISNPHRVSLLVWIPRIAKHYKGDIGKWMDSVHAAGGNDGYMATEETKNFILCLAAGHEFENQFSYYKTEHNAHCSAGVESMGLHYSGLTKKIISEHSIS